MLPNLSVLWVIFFILVLTFVVDRLLLKPVLGVIRRREQAIESARELARRSATDAQAATAEFDRKTTAARAEMYREMDEMRRAALGRRAEIVAQTRAEAEAQVAEAITRLDAEAAEARRKLEADAQALGAGRRRSHPGAQGIIRTMITLSTLTSPRCCSRWPRSLRPRLRAPRAGEPLPRPTPPAEAGQRGAREAGRTRPAGSRSSPRR